MHGQGRPTCAKLCWIRPIGLCSYPGIPDSFGGACDTRPGCWELSSALQAAVANRGGSAEIVEILVNLRADVDFQFDPRRALLPLGRLLFAAKSLQHTWGKATQLTATAYHSYGRTPLMGALQSAQHEGAAALIALGARLDIKNLRGWTAMDFAKEESIPEWLHQGLEGDTAECDRVTALALAYVEASF